MSVAGVHIGCTVNGDQNHAVSDAATEPFPFALCGVRVSARIHEPFRPDSAYSCKRCIARLPKKKET